MGAVVEALIHSLSELTKRKVKRSAHIWSSRLSEIYNRRRSLNEGQIKAVIRHIVDNNLEGQPKSKELIKFFLPTVSQLGSLDLQDTAALCYALCTIDADHDARALLSRNVVRDNMVNADPFNQSVLMRSVAICASRHVFQDNNCGQGDIQGCSNPTIYDSIIQSAMVTLQNLNANMNTSSIEYKVIGDLLVETLLLLDLLKGDLGFFSGSHRFIDYGSLDGRILVSHLLSEEHKHIIEKQISTSSYVEVLSILRRFYYMRLPHPHYAKNLFTRLCNTSGAGSHICRVEARRFLDNQIGMLVRNQMLQAGGQQTTNDLLVYLNGIKKTGLLESSHVSTHRWNHPVMIPQNG